MYTHIHTKIQNMDTLNHLEEKDSKDKAIHLDKPVSWLLTPSRKPVSTLLHFKLKFQTLGLRQYGIFKYKALLADLLSSRAYQWLYDDFDTHIYTSFQNLKPIVIPKLQKSIPLSIPKSRKSIPQLRPKYPKNAKYSL